MEQLKPIVLTKAGHEFIKRCIAYVEESGMTDEGLYRVSGSIKLTDNLLDLALNGTEIGELFTSVERSDLINVKTVTSALKCFVRNLQEPLITNKMYPHFIKAGSESE